MTIFDQKRLSDTTFKLDIERMRRGWYSDKYFVNIARMLSALAIEGYAYGEGMELPSGRLPEGAGSEDVQVGNLEVEMQWFTRRSGKTIVVGVDKALTMLRHCTGWWDGDQFIDTSKNLEVWAVHDGAIVNGTGDPSIIQPVIRVRGRYRDFATLETPTLGVLTRSSRVATNVYQTLMAARGKPVLFFPARFDAHEVQAADGYAYNIAVQRFNKDHARTLGPFVSTDAQGDWWGGLGGGTVAHAAIACFLGNTAEATLAFARVLPVSIPRIALVDFNNDCVTDALSVCKAMFNRYRECIEAGDKKEAERYKLYGVRLDTAGNLRDISIPPLGDPLLDLGVNPRLVFLVRLALDTDWKNWNLPKKWQGEAKKFSQTVRIVVSGGFTPEKIERFEHLRVPVDTYAVGSAMFDNHGPSVTDFTADVVRVKLHDQWIDMAKIGRSPSDNSDLKRVW